jgi:hypothetical protein
VDDILQEEWQIGVTTHLMDGLKAHGMASPIISIKTPAGGHLQPVASFLSLQDLAGMNSQLTAEAAVSMTA